MAAPMVLTRSSPLLCRQASNSCRTSLAHCTRLSSLLHLWNRPHLLAINCPHLKQASTEPSMRHSSMLPTVSSMWDHPYRTFVLHYRPCLSTRNGLQLMPRISSPTKAVSTDVFPRVPLWGHQHRTSLLRNISSLNGSQHVRRRHTSAETSQEHSYVYHKAPLLAHHTRTVFRQSHPHLTSTTGTQFIPRRHASTEASSSAEPASSWYVDMFGPESPPVQLAMSVLEHAHAYTGLPWWATIVGTTLALRFSLTLPLAVYQAYIFARVENLQPEFRRFSAALQRQVAITGEKRGWTDRQKKAKFYFKMREFRTALYIRDNCHPFKGTLLVYVQLPLWICVSFALRHMTGTFQGGAASSALQPDMACQGALWFTDLTAADPSMVLPVLLGVINLVNIEMHSLQKLEKTRAQKFLTNFFRSVSVLMVFIAAYMPAAMPLYWVTSSAAGLAQNLLLKLPRLRRACGIPPAPSDSPTPFRDMATALRQKVGRESRKPREKP